MSQPPQDRPDYPWGPSASERSEPGPSAGPAGAERPGAPEAPRYGEAPRSGGATRASAAGAPDPEPRPYTGAPQGTSYAGTAPSAPASPREPYTGTPVVRTPDAGGYAGTPAPERSGAAGPAPTSTIVLLVVSGLAVVTGLFTIAGVPAVVLAIIALVRHSADPAGARRLARIGWWVFGALVVLSVLLVVGAIALAISLGIAGSSGFGTSPDPFGSTALLALVGR